MKVNFDLYNEIEEYCKLNHIENIDKFINKLIQKGFTIEKYGDKMQNIVIVPEKIAIEEVDEPIDEPIVEPVVEKSPEIPQNNTNTNQKKDIYGE